MAKEFAARPARVRLRSHAKAPSGALQKAPSERGLASEASLGEYSVWDGVADGAVGGETQRAHRAGRSAETSLRRMLGRGPLGNAGWFSVCSCGGCPERDAKHPQSSHWAGNKVWPQPARTRGARTIRPTSRGRSGVRTAPRRARMRGGLYRRIMIAGGIWSGSFHQRTIWLQPLAAHVPSPWKVSGRRIVNCRFVSEMFSKSGTGFRRAPF